MPASSGGTIAATSSFTLPKMSDLRYAPPPAWKPPAFVVPSDQFEGEEDTAVIHQAVGRALSRWEHAEAALIKLFQLLCETRSFAACRAYGTIETVFGRYLAQKYAADEFFRQRDPHERALVLQLLKVYNDASAYRNQIAHGMAMQPHRHGYFLCPQTHASRRRETPYPYEEFGFGASYFLRVAEIDHCTEHFEAILNAAMSMAMALNEKYKVMNPGDFHP